MHQLKWMKRRRSGCTQKKCIKNRVNREREREKRPNDRSAKKRSTQRNNKLILFFGTFTISSSSPSPPSHPPQWPIIIIPASPLGLCLRWIGELQFSHRYLSVVSLHSPKKQQQQLKQRRRREETGFVRLNCISRADQTVINLGWSLVHVLAIIIGRLRWKLEGVFLCAFSLSSPASVCSLRPPSLSPYPSFCPRIWFP